MFGHGGELCGHEFEQKCFPARPQLQSSECDNIATPHVITGGTGTGTAVDITGASSSAPARVNGGRRDSRSALRYLEQKAARS